MDEFRSWIREHKVAAAALVVGVFFVGFVLLSATTMLLGGPGLQMSEQTARMDGATAGGSGMFNLETSADLAYRGDGGKTGAGSFVEVQEARFDIESEDASADAEQVKSLAETHDGYVEERRKHESSLYRTIELTVRVPDSDFDAFVDSVQDEYEVESFNVRNYRLSTQREVDELIILNRTMAEYEEIRQRIGEMSTSQEKIQLLMDLTEKELEVQEKRRHYEQRLEDKQKRGDEATIRIELRERKNVDVWPENLGNRFMNNVKEMFNAVTNIVLGTVTQAVVLFFMAIQAIIYLVVVAIPLLAAYRIGRRLYEKYWK